MSLKAIITTLILGSSSLALAAPSTYAPVVRDHRAQIADHRVLPIRPMPPVYAPVTLADNTKLEGRESIRVAQGDRTFNTIELRAEQGKTSIDKVIVTYANGRSQTFVLDAKLTKKAPSVSIDLRGEQRSIQRITLIGKSSGRNASLDVIAV